MEAAKALTTRLPAISKLLEEVHLVERECEAASVEDSDYTIYSASDLDFEYGLVKEGLTKKLAFIENQVAMVAWQVQSRILHTEPLSPNRWLRGA